MSNYPQGINFDQALAILSSRGKQEETKHEAPCPCHAATTTLGTLPPMGQVIDLEGTTTTSKSDQDEQNQKTGLKEEFLQGITKMSTRQLLQAVLESQQQRVATYRDYDRGLQAVLATNNVAFYPTVCTEATAAFSVVSDTIKALEAEMQKRSADGKEFCTLIRNLQRHEQLKLQYTAALHLEQIRLHQVADDDQDATKPLLQQSVSALQSKLAACVKDINEALEEIQCSLVDAANDDGTAT